MGTDGYDPPYRRAPVPGLGRAGPCACYGPSLDKNGDVHVAVALSAVLLSVVLVPRRAMAGLRRRHVAEAAIRETRPLADRPMGTQD